MSAAWALCPLILVRVPLLPLEALEDTRLRVVLARHREDRALLAQLRTRGEALALALGRLVPSARDVPTRRALLLARRDLYAGRALAEGAWRGAVGEEAPGLAAKISAWEGDLHRQAMDRAAEDGAWEATLEAVDRATLALLHHPDLRRAVALENPGLLAALPPSDAGPPTRRQRQKLSRAVRYLWRATLKPVPRGGLVGTALARPGPTAVGVLRARRGEIHLDLGALAPLHAALARSASGRLLLRLARAPGRLGPPADRRAHTWLDLLGLSLSDAEIARALETGRLAWVHAPTGEAELDALEEALWSAVWLDPALLPELAAIARLRALRKQAEEAPLELAAPGAAPPPLHQDTWIHGLIRLDSAELAPVCAEIARWGPGAELRRPGLDAAALAALFRRLHPEKGAVALVRFHEEFSNFCKTEGVAVDPWAPGLPLASALGLPDEDPVLPWVKTLEAALVGPGPAILRPALGPDLGAGPPQRACARLQEVAPGPAGRRFFLALWGADRMSLLPRYAGLLGAEGRSEAAAWFQRWPALADLTGATARGVDARPPLAPHALPVDADVAGALDLEQVAISLDPAGRFQLRLPGPGGAEISLQPAFFGVSADDQLHPLARLLCRLARRPPALLELLTEAINRIIWARIARACTRDEAVILPEIGLGDALVLSPATWILPASAFPARAQSRERAAYLAFVDRCDALGLPVGLVGVRTGPGDPLWLDLAHPEGPINLGRALSGAPWALLSPAAPSPTPLLTAPEGAYIAELVLELAIG